MSISSVGRAPACQMTYEYPEVPGSKPGGVLIITHRKLVYGCDREGTLCILVYFTHCFSSLSALGIWWWRLCQETVHCCLGATLTACSLSALVTSQQIPAMCSRTPCAQVHGYPYSWFCVRELEACDHPSCCPQWQKSSLPTWGSYVTARSLA